MRGWYIHMEVPGAVVAGAAGREATGAADGTAVAEMEKAAESEMEKAAESEGFGKPGNPCTSRIGCTCKSKDSNPSHKRGRKWAAAAADSAAAKAGATESRGSTRGRHRWSSTGFGKWVSKRLRTAVVTALAVDAVAALEARGAAKGSPNRLSARPSPIGYCTTRSIAELGLGTSQMSSQMRSTTRAFPAKGQ
jgi:hypothetical protein